jgi:geranylgeranyl diphosphate synthase, type I
VSPATAADLARIVGRHAEALERELRRSVPPIDRSGLYAMLHYHLGWVDAEGHAAGGAGGKKLRPTLLLLAAEAAGGDPDVAMPAAAAVELLHNFSLIHDDIQDRSDERHGRPVVWSIWGTAQAINAGDAMHATAARTALRCAEAGASAVDTLEVAAMLHECCLRLVEGQYLDLEYERRDDVTSDDYFRMIEGKTGALLVTCIEVGALLGGGRAKLEEWRRFGRHLGRAFQIVDDGLGAWGDPKVTGKPAADDVVKGKRALPFLLACQRLPAVGAARLREIYGRAETAAEAVDLITRSGARTVLREAAEADLTAALAALVETGATGRGADDLRAVARFVVERDR